MTQITNVVKEDTDSLQLISWANDAYKGLDLPVKYDLKYAVLNVENHKAKLPNDVKKILDIRHSPYSPDGNIRTLLEDYGDYRLIIYQQIFFGDPYWKTFKPIKYIGQNRYSAIDDTLYCNHCQTGFSVDSKVSCLTIDLPDGEIVIEYFSVVRDEDNILIPDDIDLVRGLALYAEHQYWRNKAATHEQMAKTFADEALMSSTLLINKFRGKEHLRRINVSATNEFVFGRNRTNYSNNHRQRRYRG